MTKDFYNTREGVDQRVYSGYTILSKIKNGMSENKHGTNKSMEC